MAKPSVGDSYRDPIFGTTVHRVTGSADAKSRTPLASALPMWNADESLLLVSVAGNTYELYDGRTYAFLERPPFSASSTGQVYWHRSNPDLLFFFNPTASTLQQYSVSAKTSVPVFGPDPRCASVSGGFSYSSWSSGAFGTVCASSGGVRSLGVVRDGGLGGLLQTTGYEPPMPTASGQYVVSGRTVYDNNLAPVRDLAISVTDQTRSMGIGPDGGDVLYSLSFSGPAVGSIVAWPIDGAAPTVLIGQETGGPYPPSGSTVSATAFDRPRWVLASSVAGPEEGVFHGELYLADTHQPGRFCRLAHHHSSYLTSATLSPSGTRAAFASDWGQGTFDVYVVEFAPPVVATDGGVIESPLTKNQFGVGCTQSSAAWPMISLVLLVLLRRTKTVDQNGRPKR